jgi:peptidoglycan/LPS O-acetylase OafA/YrhL
MTTPEGPSDAALPRIWIKPYYASFNGLRGLCIFLVFLTHYGYFVVPTVYTDWMYAGVDQFFVLSGFLITGILFDSRSDPRFFKNFYVRRALRIFPIFYGFFLLLLVLKPVLHTHADVSCLLYVLYVANLVVPYVNLAHHVPYVITVSLHGHRVPLNLGHLWSLCAEEQFYLIWPAVVLFVGNRQRLMRVCVIGSVATLLLRCFLWVHLSRATIDRGAIFNPTYTRCDTMLIGAWLALWLRGRALSSRELRRYSDWLMYLPLCLMVMGMAMIWRRDHTWSNPFLLTFGFTLVALVAAGILLRALDESSALSKVLRFRPLVGLGVVSYGFYFLHGLPAEWVREVSDHHPLGPAWSWLVPVCLFLGTLLIAQLSFHFFEAPLLRLKRVLAPQAAVHGSSPVAPAHLHVSEPRG